MKTTNNNPALDFVCYPHSSMGRERCVSIAKEDIARSEWREAAATTRMGILSASKRKKSRRERKITYALRDIRSEYLATPKGNYAVVRKYANLFPYEKEVITLFEKYMGRRAIEKEIRTFNDICYGEQIIKLKSPINVEWMLSEEGYSLYYEPFDISVFAPTLDECEEDFQEEFNILYNVYAKEVDEKLTEGARELKRKILNSVLVEQ